jgi:hypothetical protein
MAHGKVVLKSDDAAEYGDEQTTPEHDGASQLVPGVRPTSVVTYASERREAVVT